MSKKIRELVPSDRLEDELYLVASVTNGKNNKGADYLNIVLQDNSGTIDAKLWDVRPEHKTMIRPGVVLAFSGDALEYNKMTQVRIVGVKEVDQAMVELKNYVMASEIDMDELKKRIKTAIGSVTNPVYHAILMDIFREVGAEFFDYPAASRIHHNFLGGLAEHVSSMVAVAESLCRLYPQLDHDLLVSGILIHDIGKMTELNGPIATEYTVEGKLIGHISIMQGKVMETADKLGYGDTEEAIMLRHMVLAHHGHYEYGSPVLPMLQEAEVLYLIDNLDARMNTLKQAFTTVQPGEFTPKLFALENRSFYKPKNK